MAKHASADDTPWLIRVLKKPVTWVLAVVIAAAGAYFGDVLKGFAQSVADPISLGEQMSGQDAVKMIGPAYVNDNAMGRRGFVVQTSVSPAAMQDPRTSTQDRDKWRTDSHAVDVDVTAWEITLIGNREQDVTITRLEPVDVSCDDRLGGGFINDEPQEVTSKIILSAQIESPKRPIPVDRLPAFGSEEQPTPNFFSSQGITLKRGEKQVFVLQGVVATKHCTWNYAFTIDGKPWLLTAPDGKKFEATARFQKGTPSEPQYDWVVPGYPDMCGAWAPKPLPKVDGKKWAAGDCS